MSLAAANVTVIGKIDYSCAVAMSTEINKNKYLKKDIDLDLLIFIERYATNLLKWDLLTFFGCHPDSQQTAQDIALEVGRSYRAIRPELGDLAMLGILSKFNNQSHPEYQLTANPTLRSLTLRFACKKLSTTPYQDHTCAS